MAHRGRFELPTPRFVVWCSIQLSYRCLPTRQIRRASATYYGVRSAKASLFPNFPQNSAYSGFLRLFQHY